MPNLTQAHEELFRRSADESFPTLQALWDHCQKQREKSEDHWKLPQLLRPNCQPGAVVLGFDDQREFFLNDWSFSQLCRLCGVSKDTLNRLSPGTASRALQETMPAFDKPMQILTEARSIRSIHGVAYTRLWDADLLTMLREFATDFQPPQQAGVGPAATESVDNDDDRPPWEEQPSADPPRGGTGLYAGEQDMFCFMIDPTGWAEINGEAFAPGFFLWNSEVGRRSVGVSTFWWQSVCANHIVWDAVDVVEFTRKHTARVHDSLGEIRRIIEALIEKRDQRRDGFVNVIRKAMETTLGTDTEEVEKLLAKNGITQSLAKRATQIARRQGRLTLFSVVDALTRMAQEIAYAGDRSEADQKAAKLLALAA